MMDMKVCGQCKCEKPTTEFHKDKSKKFGVSSTCKECAILLARKHYSANTQHIKDRVRRYGKTYIPKFSRDIDSKLKNLHTNAKNRTKEFSISLDNIFDIWRGQEGRCVYTKLPLVATANQFNTVSLDRIDSSKGYIVGNIQLVCSAVNLMKLDLKENVFLSFCFLVAQNNKQPDNPVDLAVNREHI